MTTLKDIDHPYLESIRNTFHQLEKTYLEVENTISLTLKKQKSLKLFLSG